MKQLILIAILTLGGSAIAADRFFEETFPVDTGARFLIDSHKGHIQISTDNGKTIRVNARIYDGDEELMEYVDIRTRATGTSVSVEVDYDEPAVRNLWKGLVGESRTWPLVDFEIILPESVALTVISHKSSMDIAAPKGKVKIESHKGRGTVTGIRSDFDLETHKGDFEVDIEQMGDVRIETHKGNVNLRLFGNPDFTVRADSHKGDIDFQGVDVQNQAKKRGVYISQKVGNGSNYLDISSHKGNVRVMVID